MDYQIIIMLKVRNINIIFRTTLEEQGNVYFIELSMYYLEWPWSLQ